MPNVRLLHAKLSFIGGLRQFFHGQGYSNHEVWLAAVPGSRLCRRRPSASCTGSASRRGTPPPRRRQPAQLGFNALCPAEQVEFGHGSVSLVDTCLSLRANDALID